MLMSVLLFSIAAPLSGLDTLRIRVEASSAGSVGKLLQRASGWGSVLLLQGALTAPRDGTAVLTAVAGEADDGRKVIALLDEPFDGPVLPLLGGSYVNVRQAACFTKPSQMSYMEAAQFPLLGLRAAAALGRLGWDVPGPADALVHADQTVLIAGGAGRMPSLLVQLLRCCGAEPVVAARSTDSEELLRRGARRVINHDAEDWAYTLSDECETVRECPPSSTVAAVLDCVGEEEVPELVQEQLGSSARWESRTALMCTIPYPRAPHGSPMAVIPQIPQILLPLICLILMHRITSHHFPSLPITSHLLTYLPPPHPHQTHPIEPLAAYVSLASPQLTILTLP
jgi:hypothetical protein